MNNGLNGEGKNVIKDVDNDSKFAENLTNFYNNKELNEKNKSTSVMSDTVKLEKKEDSEVANNIYNFVMKLKDNIMKFINPKKIVTEEEYKDRISICRSLTLVPAFFSLFYLIDTHGIFFVFAFVLLAISYYLLGKNNKTGIFTAIAASVLLVISFRFINIVVGLVYFYGNILLLRYKKDS